MKRIHHHLRPVALAAFAAFASFLQILPAAEDLIYHNSSRLLQAKEAIAAHNPYFADRYAKLIEEADALLHKMPDPVVNKTIMPPSGDKHDYLSLPPYGWPDKTKKDGLPWKAIDGVTNPVSRGLDTDYTRLNDLGETLARLSFAYWYSGDKRYSDKALEHLRAWFVDPETRVNPNANFGQGMPGQTDGRAAGIIEWSRVANVITALQILEIRGVLPEDVKAETSRWLRSYLHWLLTNKLGKEADELPQNHANWYNYQVVGLMLYTGRLDEAKARVEHAKISRIAAQILPDGRQPRETGRTKSLHYSMMNLWAMTNLAFMGRELGIDLWDFQTDDGRSLRKAYAYLEPFARGEQKWPFQQITPGGAEPLIANELLPLFAKGSALLDCDVSGSGLDGSARLSALDGLQYPPPSRLAPAAESDSAK